MLFTDFRTHFSAYLTGKSWYWYLPLWFFGVYAFIQLLRFDMINGIAGVLMIPYSFNFTLHEFAHILTGFLPSLLTAAAGSFSELLLGTGLVLGAFYYRNYFASMICLLWFDLACQSAGTYMADAVPQRLPLVSLGGAFSGQDPLHDWHYVFEKLHILGASGAIGNTIRFIGHVAGLAGVIFAAWIIYKMAARASEPKESTDSATHIKPHTIVTPVKLDSDAINSIYPTPTKGAFGPHTDPRLTSDDSKAHDKNP